MNIPRHRPLRGIWFAVVFAAVAGATLLVPALEASAGPSDSYRATFVELLGGPNSPPQDCPPGTSCGSAYLGALGHGSTTVAFGACGQACHVRTIDFSDGSQLEIHEMGDIAGFESPGNSGHHGYNGGGLPGNAQVLTISQTFVGGTGRFAGATGSAEGFVKIAGGVATIQVTGTLTLL